MQYILNNNAVRALFVLCFLLYKVLRNGNHSIPYLSTLAALLYPRGRWHVPIFGIKMTSKDVPKVIVNMSGEKRKVLE